MNKKDVFDILGISNREDSYTNLIKHAFNHSCEFKENFCRIFAGYHSSDFRLVVRSPQVSTHDKLKKAIPDLLLISKEMNEIILIENKIFSQEGFNQTERYSTKEFVESLKRKYQMSNAKVDQFYYMTLDGTIPYSNQFKAIKWVDMILSSTKNVQFTDDRLKLLMNDLIERLIHYENFKNLDDNMPFIQYLNSCEKWVNNSQAFKLLFKDVFEKLAAMYSVNATISNFNANSNQMLIVFNHEKWNRLWMEKKKMINATDEYALTMSKCRNIHIEMNWTKTREIISLYIHYETNPYLTQKVME